LAEEIIAEFGERLETITLVKGMGGRFEVSVDGQLIFSKAQEKRHAEPGEVVEKMQESVARGRGRDVRG
jgi:selenoprotein W-related protein